MSKKKILLLIPNLDFGGAQRSFSKLSVLLATQHDVYVAVFNTYSGVCYPYGGRLIDLNVSGGDTVLEKAERFYQRVRKIREVKRQHQIDVCISFLEGADYVNVLSREKERVIVSIRGSKVHDGEINGWIGKLRIHILMPFGYRKADKIVAVSEGIRAEMINQLKQDARKVLTIYNYYEVEEIENQAAEPLTKAQNSIYDRPVIITSGRLHIQKAPMALIDIFEQVKARTDARLVIIGDGELKDQIIHNAKQKGLKVFDNNGAMNLEEDYDIYLLGYQENPFKFLAKADVFAFTSSWEGFPNSLAESMICGLPVVSTDCPTGPREILAPNTTPASVLKQEEYAEYGILMPLLNQPDYQAMVELWGKIVSQLIVDKTLQKEYARKAKERMAAFRIEKIADQWEAIIA